MEVGGLTETVSVVASQVIIDTSSTTTGAVLSSELLDRVPVGRRFSDTLYLAPGVSSGGLGRPRATRRSPGGSGLDNQYVVDGVNVTNQGYGALGSYSIVFGSLGNATPFDFIKEVQVKTGGYEAEFGQSTGRRGQRRHQERLEQLPRLGVRLLAARRARRPTTRTFQSDERHRATPCENEQSDVGVEVGGRIIRNRVFFFGAINPSWETRDVHGAGRASRSRASARSSASART